MCEVSRRARLWNVVRGLLVAWGKQPLPPVRSSASGMYFALRQQIHPIRSCGVYSGPIGLLS
ncbi:hypothetical protein M407DRAFT_243452 [Tulasnella calospora MUT 4182]|uniref:Uncharacterized protein n=1 Tax=Tulasnella calospora MUT 4182 TaxID=1051891 RepID=A0A0C3QA75_9AGAM|nr:hypothetical protein M407DRAFT_243452 [Tulasnella calospora MUT 4182]